MCVSDETTYNAVFFVAMSSNSIVFVDVTSAISFESNFPSDDCNELNIDWNVLSALGINSTNLP